MKAKLINQSGVLKCAKKLIKNRRKSENLGIKFSHKEP